MILIIFKLRLIKQQEESEEVMANMLYDISIDKKGQYKLIDAEIGEVSDLRFKYVCDDIRINRRRLEYMMDHLCDWSDTDALEAQSALVEETELEFPEEEVPKE